MNNCKPMRKPPFPAMSAHFAHTLDDMEEKYVRLQFIEITESSGTLKKEDLDRLILSRENKIIFGNAIFNLTTVDNDTYTYISTRVKEENYLEFYKLILDKTTGVYSTNVVKMKDEETVEELTYDVANIKENLNRVNTTLETLGNTVAKKVEVSMSVDPDDEDNIILNIFR